MRSRRLAGFALVAALAGCKKTPVDLGARFDGGGSAAPIASVYVPVVVIPRAVDAGPAVNPDLAKARDWLADLQWCVAHKATQNPANAGEGDSSTECDDVTALRAKSTDAVVNGVLDDAAALCAFDIPLVTANEALDHLRNSTSQASHLLMCTVATNEIAKARAVHPKDAKVARADARRAALCK